MVHVSLDASAGHGYREAFDVSTEMFLIGGSEEAQLRIVDPIVSPMHCAVCRRPDMAVLLDFGSWPGTSVNGRFFRNGILQLRDGDTLQLGPMTIGVRISLDAAQVGGPDVPSGARSPGQAVRTADWSGVPGKPELGTTRHVEVVNAGSLTVIGFRSRGLPKSGSIHEYRTELFHVLERCQTEILGVDLEGLRYIPSEVLGVLSSVRQRVAELHLYRPSADVRRTLETVRFDEHVHVTEAPDWLE